MFIISSSLTTSKSKSSLLLVVGKNLHRILKEGEGVSHDNDDGHDDDFFKRLLHTFSVKC